MVERAATPAGMQQCNYERISTVCVCVWGGGGRFNWETDIWGNEVLGGEKLGLILNF